MASSLGGKLRTVSPFLNSGPFSEPCRMTIAYSCLPCRHDRWRPRQTAFRHVTMPYRHKHRYYPYGIRTRDSGLRDRHLNRLTNGQGKTMGVEPMTSRATIWYASNYTTSCINSIIFSLLFYCSDRERGSRTLRILSANGL